VVGLVAGIAQISVPPLAGANLAMAFLAAVFVSAALFGLGPGLTAAVAAGVTYNYLFLDPRLTFRIAHPADLVTFGVFLLAALIAGGLAGRVREQAWRAQAQARITAALLEASRKLSAAPTQGEAARALADQIAAAAGGAVVVLTPQAGALRILAAPEGLDTLSDTNASLAEQVWETGVPTPPHEMSDWRFSRLEGVGGRIGVLGLRGVASARDERLLEALVQQGAAALERAGLAKAASENEALRRADELRSALLNSISHDLRTPLASVLGSATTLIEFDADLKPGVKRDLLQNIAQEARRLNRYVGDLLDMGRLEAGALRPKSEWTDVRDVANAAIARLPPDAARRVTRDFSRDLSKVRLDAALLEQSLFNVLENAASHGGEAGRIEVAAFEDLAHVLIAVDDDGPGIPAQALHMIFDRFKRLQEPSDRSGGLGLGLAIAKGFVEAMQGRIEAVSPIVGDRGARIVISLPKTTPTPRDLL
jgi:two-component system sensor histidine kinase KdpD